VPVPDQLEALLDGQQLWRAGEPGMRPGGPVLPSGFDHLDACLGGGWPQGALIECLAGSHGIGELSLLMPVLARLSRQPSAATGWLMLVAPPHLPHVQAWQQHGVDVARLLIIRASGRDDIYWAIEQGLRSGACAAVLGWAGPAATLSLKRLHLAARDNTVLSVLFRPPRCRQQHSPASLRIALASAGSGRLHLELFRRRGQGMPTSLVLDPAGG